MNNNKIFYKMADLGQIDRASLVNAWDNIMDAPIPANISTNMLQLILAWEIQAKQSKPSVKKLERTVRTLLKTTSSCKDSSKKRVRPKALSLSPGTQLVRQWNGKSYHVNVVDQGFVYDARVYKTLSPIALIITGSKRSGPHFFGVSR